MGISRAILKNTAVGFAVLCCGAGTLLAAQPECRPDTVFLRGDWGQARFTVDVADEEEERARGLMHVDAMPSSKGMLFVYDRPQSLTFWMRNTLIELDMIFVDAAGVVQHIHHRAQPHDETTIFGGKDLLAALEINGGLARRLGIGPGTVVRHPAFDADVAAWPC